MVFTSDQPCRSHPGDWPSETIRKPTYDAAKHILTLVDPSNPNSALTPYEIKSYADLKGLQNNLDSEKFNALLSDSTLYKLVFGNENSEIKIVASGSSNNLFDLGNAWGVRRVPEQSAIKEFVQNYFNNGDKNDTTRFYQIWEKIKNGNSLDDKFRWLNLFFKQTKPLYYKTDRALNILLPLLISTASIIYSSHYFKWSVR